ncbi:hypothetical protein [Bacillus sp. UMB0893]|uniref:hypothetical protein n=1 Tax=Bacillus sp. UMB0893 TaxID=2066053 RepID=UPI001C60A98B|nr:hypothetical protein [Bacillus sp. UMB0893]
MKRTFRKEKRNRLFNPGIAEKDPTGKSGVNFIGGAVLTEGLGGGAGQLRKAVSISAISYLFS